MQGGQLVDLSHHRVLLNRGRELRRGCCCCGGGASLLLLIGGGLRSLLILPGVLLLPALCDTAFAVPTTAAVRATRGSSWHVCTSQLSISVSSDASSAAMTSAAGMRSKATSFAARRPHGRRERALPACSRT